ncbi:MAG: hypothetical protein QXV17_09665 [Candidatus Micrarchaeaceae archaeon]
MKYKITFRMVAVSPFSNELLRNKQMVSIVDASSIEEAREEAERRIKRADEAFGGFVYLYVEDISPVNE